MTTQHTPAPWHVAKDDPTAIFNSMGGYVTRIDGNAVQTRAAIEGNAAFIVRACNAHDELVAAHQSVIEWTGDDHNMPNEANARLEWYARRLLMIRNCSRAALAKVSK